MMIFVGQFPWKKQWRQPKANKFASNTKKVVTKDSRHSFHSSLKLTQDSHGMKAKCFCSAALISLAGSAGLFGPNEDEGPKKVPIQRSRIDIETSKHLTAQLSTVVTLIWNHSRRSKSSLKQLISSSHFINKVDKWSDLSRRVQLVVNSPQTSQHPTC